jgi:tRNA dimethylallyltransferase
VKRATRTPDTPLPPTVIIAGPTATGKTDLSLELARRFDAPVISADARQCYRYMDIGTGKASPEILAEIPHYHISTLYPDEPFTASDFHNRFLDWSRDIAARGKPVIVAGGSTLYIESLIRPLDPLPPKNEENIRELELQAERDGPESIRKKLLEVDPAYLERIDGFNPHRMFRALDVWMQTGRPFSSFHSNRPLRPPENMMVICLDRDRTELHGRISRRVDQMMADGLVDEVRGILEMGYDPGLQALQTVGYREVIAHLHGAYPESEIAAHIKTGTRRYARRQLTWFRRWEQVAWIGQTGVSGKKIADQVCKMTEELAAEA